MSMTLRICVVFTLYLSTSFSACKLVQRNVIIIITIIITTMININDDKIIQFIYENFGIRLSYVILKSFVVVVVKLSKISKFSSSLILTTTAMMMMIADLKIKQTFLALNHFRLMTLHYIIYLLGSVS
jgi:hypothetical protein